MNLQAQPKGRLQTALRARLVDEQTLIVALGAAIILVMLAHFAFLTVYPPVFIDEPWFSNATWTWLKTGVNFDAIHAGVLDQFGYAWVRRPFLGELPWLISFATLGLGLFQARLVSWIFGGLLLVLTIVVGRQSYSRVTGLLAALMLSLSPSFLQASHYARPDILLAAVVMLAFSLATLGFEREKWWAHALAGLLIGLSPDFHPNGILFAPALAGVYLAAYGFQVLRQKGTWLCFLGGLIGIIYYAGLHILPSPSAYFTLYSLNVAGPQTSLLNALNPMSLLTATAAEYARYHFYANNLDFAVVGASLAYIAVRRSKADRYLLSFVAISLVCFAVYPWKKTDLYAILLYPFFMLMAAETLGGLIRAGQAAGRQQIFAGGLLLLFLFSSALHVARPFYDNKDYNYYAAASQIRQVIPANARVLGSPLWWLGLPDYDYRSTHGLRPYQFFNGYSLTKSLNVIRPDYLIVDPILHWTLVDAPYLPPGLDADVFQMPSVGINQELADFLTQHAKLVLEFTDAWHGLVQVYAIHWDSGS